MCVCVCVCLCTYLTAWCEVSIAASFKSYSLFHTGSPRCMTCIVKTSRDTLILSRMLEAETLQCDEGKQSSGERQQSRGVYWVYLNQAIPFTVYVLYPLTNTESEVDEYSSENFLRIWGEWQETSLLRNWRTKFDSRRVFTYSAAHTTLQCNGLRGLFPRRLPELEASHSSLSSSEVCNMWVFTSPYQHVSTALHLSREGASLLWFDIKWRQNEN